MQAEYNFDGMLNAFLVANKEFDNFTHHAVLNEKYIINYTGNTSCAILRDGTDTVCLVGFCVDAVGEIEKQNVLSELLKVFKQGYDYLAQFLKRIAGHYALICCSLEEIIAFPDATASVPIYYDVIKSESLGGGGGVPIF